MAIGSIPVPPSHIDEEPTVQLCINREWTRVLIGQIWGLRYPEAWGGTLDENRRARKEIQNLITMLMGEENCDMSQYCCVPAPTITRINSITGIVEISFNNGNTWNMQGGGFPSYIVRPVPPVTSGVSGSKCDAAINVKEQVQAWVDHVTNDFDTATTLLEFGIAVIEAIAAAVVLILTAGTLTAAEALIMSAIGAGVIAAWGAGKTVFTDYWESDTVDKIRCYAYCTIGEDGSFDDAQFSAFWNKCNTGLAASPAKMLFMGFLSSVGASGVSAMAAANNGSDGDCSDCDCDASCDLENWAVKIFNGSPMGTEISRTDTTITVESVVHPDFGQYVTQIQSNGDDVCCQLMSLEFVTGTTDGAFAVECDLPRWPATELNGIGSYPVDGNTFHVRNVSTPFTVIYHFDS